MYTVYVLKSRTDGKLYYGMTRKLEERLVAHNTGKVRSTKHRAPFIVVHTETVSTREAARRKEKYFKSGYGRKYINNKLKLLAPSSNG